MSTWDGKSFRSSGRCQPTYSNVRAAAVRPINTPDCAFDLPEPESGPEKLIDVCFKWDNGIAIPGNTPYLLTLDNGKRIEGTLDNEGRLSTRASCKTFRAFLHPNFSGEEIQNARAKLKQELDKILAAEEEEANKLKEAQAKRSTLEKIYYNGVAFFKGFGQGALDTYKLIVLLDPGTRLVLNSSTAAMNAKSSENQSRFESFLLNLVQEERNSMTELLGFDLSSVKKEDLTEAFELLRFILADEPSKELLSDFAIKYVKTQNNEKLFKLAGTLAFEIALAAILTFFTGVGGAAKGSSTLIKSLSPVGKTLKDLGNKLRHARLNRDGQTKGSAGESAHPVEVSRPSEVKPGPKLDNKSEPKTHETKNSSATGGAARAAQYSTNWREADLNSTVDKFSGPNPVVSTTEKGKKIYKNPENGIEVVEDLNGNYFRIYDPSKSGKRKYLDLEGTVPTNKTLPNGTQAGRTQSEYNEVTHFKKELQK